MLFYLKYKHILKSCYYDYDDSLGRRLNKSSSMVMLCGLTDPDVTVACMCLLDEKVLGPIPLAV